MLRHMSYRTLARRLIRRTKAAEEAAHVARATRDRAIYEGHLSGLSLRELGEVWGLSHEAVRQICARAARDQ